MKKRLPLAIHVSSLFLLVITLVMTAIGSLSYITIRDILRQNAQDKSNEITQQIVSSVQSVISPAEIIVSIVANSSLAEAGSLSERMKKAGLLKRVLLDNDNLTAVYIGYEQGDFFLLRRMNSEVEKMKYHAPEETQFMAQSIELQKGNLIGSYIFLDRNLQILEVEPKLDYPRNYIPRQRPWYQEALKSGSTIITDPYVFFANRKVGITVATQANKRTAVVAADIQLDTLGSILEKQKPTPNSRIVISSIDGSVIADSEAITLVNENNTDKNKLTLKQLDQLESPILTEIRTLQKDDRGLMSTDTTSIFVDNKNWEVAIHPFSMGGENLMLLMSAIPEDELLADAIKLKNTLLMLSAFILVAALLIGILLARLIANPIKLLALEADNIRQLNVKNVGHVKSRIYEIALLGDALNHLNSTISAFTSYIPRDLVAKLLMSDKGIEIGGESRYLTVLFSDLKDFSTLSEITPSKELLRRVSSYLELMTHTIQEENGTVDKFIGDSVMAFWGAPSLDPDHAYHAAVSAIKTKRRMVALNKQLADEGKPPLIARFGINSDAVLVGNIGSEERLSYTVMGDGVNIASRLEGVNKEFGTDILISHSVFKEAGERLWVRPIDKIVVKGREGETLIYELLGIKGSDPELAATPIEQELCKLTTQAYKAYVARNFHEATSLYEEIVIKYNDELSKVMLCKCHKFTTQ
jgi:adenylate cyclase